MKNKGFTLIELMIVVSIMGILLAIAVPNFLIFQCRTEGSNLELNQELVSQLCTKYRTVGDTTSVEALRLIANEESTFADFGFFEETSAIEPTPEGIPKSGIGSINDASESNKRVEKLEAQVKELRKLGEMLEDTTPNLTPTRNDNESWRD